MHPLELRKKLSSATDRLDRYIIAAEGVDDQECDEYYLGSDQQYRHDIELLVNEARKLADGLGWYSK